MTANSYEKNDKSGVVICHICYGIYAFVLITFIAFIYYDIYEFSWIAFIPPIIGMWINYFNRSIATSVCLSHHNWMIKTFWMSVWILVFILAIAVMMTNIVNSQITSARTQSIVLLTMGIMFLVWYIYRIVKGWRRLCERKSIG